MGWLDRFFETKLKRTVVVFLLVQFSILLIVLANYRLGVILSSFDDIALFFSLIINPLVSETFIGRLIFLGLDFMNRFSDYQRFFFVVLGLKQWTLIIGSFLIFTTKGEEQVYQRIKGLLLVNWLIIVLQYLVVIILVLIMSSSIDVNLVAQLMRWFGITMIVASLLNGLWLLISSFKVISFLINAENSE